MEISREDMLSAARTHAAKAEMCRCDEGVKIEALLSIAGSLIVIADMLNEMCKKGESNNGKVD